jgi:hypothetical protein
VEHFAKVHKETSVSRQHADRANVAHTSKVNQQLTYAASDIVSSGGQKDIKGKKALTTIAQTVNSTTLSRFKLTPEQRQLSSQAQWYVYSDMKVSKRSFENQYFKKMLQVWVAVFLSRF